MRVLLIEDGQPTEPLSMTLKLRWPDCSIILAPEGTKGVELAETASPDIIILGIDLHDIDGFEVLRRIRLFSDVPVVILTARGEEMDRVRGLEAGADDYIVKPFSPLEFLARVKSALRRSGGIFIEGDVEGNGPPLVCGDLTVHFGSKEVFFRGEPLRLTPTEYQLLYHLVRKSDRFISSRTLEQWIWGHDGAVDSSVLRRYIYQLRRKINDTSSRIIVSEIGKGYKLVLSSKGPVKMSAEFAGSG